MLQQLGKNHARSDRWSEFRNTRMICESPRHRKAGVAAAGPARAGTVTIGALRAGVDTADVETGGPPTTAGGKGGATERTGSLTLPGLAPTTAPPGVDRVP